MKHQRNIFRVLRDVMNLSLKDMGALCKVSAEYYNELERGVKKNPSAEVIWRIATACGTKPYVIEFYYDKDPATYKRVLIKGLEMYVDARKDKGAG